jgi:hypothetical protein
MSQHVSQTVSQNPGHPKAPGMYVSNRSQKAEVSQRRPKLCLIEIPKIMGSQGVPKVILNPLPISTVSQTCPKQTSQTMMYNQTPCHLADRVGPIRMWSNVPVTTTEMLAQTMPSTTLLVQSVIVGSYTGHMSKIVGCEEASLFGVNGRRGLACA